MAEPNQNPEQIARDRIDARLVEAGWKVQAFKALDFSAGPGIAVREYQTDIGPVDYLLLVDRQPVGVIEAKPDTMGHKITMVEEQSRGYAAAAKKYLKDHPPLPFVYEATGTLTRFTDGRDPHPRSREVFTFHRPETLGRWFAEAQSLRARLHDLPALPHTGLRRCQIDAIENLEESFRQDRPCALIQMATGSGKTYTAITSVYRLLKHSRIGRVLFLVDTRNLGEQAEQEFVNFVPSDDNRPFTQLYNVRRLASRHVLTDTEVCISTIQRMYAILKDEEIDEAAEDHVIAEQLARGRPPVPVVYNPKVPPEFFDLIVIDECHRSI